MQDFAANAQALLTAQIEAVSSLSHLLEQEYEILKTTQARDLEQLAGEKQRQVSKIEQANRSWQDLLNQNKVAITLDDIHRQLEYVDQQQNTKLNAMFIQLGDIARKVQQQNTINGAVLSIRQETTHQLLSVLYGQEAPSTYGPSGKKDVGSGGHTIAEV